MVGWEKEYFRVWPERTASDVFCEVWDQAMGKYPSWARDPEVLEKMNLRSLSAVSSVVSRDINSKEMDIKAVV